MKFLTQSYNNNNYDYIINITNSEWDKTMTLAENEFKD